MSSETIKSFISKQIICNALRENKFTKQFDDSIIKEIMHSMCQKEFPKGSVIMGGNKIGPHLFVIEEGQFKVLESGKTKPISGITGKLYGEEEFLISNKKLESLKAITKCKTWMLDRESFKEITRRSGENKKNFQILKDCPLFKNANEELLPKIADLIVLQSFGTDEEVKMQRNTLYIISNGCVKILNAIIEKTEKIQRVLKRCDHFQDEPKSRIRIVAFHPGVELLAINKDALNQLIREKESVDSKGADKKIDQDCYSNIKLEELERVAMLGHGGFGRVDLVRHSQIQQPFAMKIIEKHRMVLMQQQNHLISEREVLMNFEHPFIIRLYRTFRDTKYIYMLFEAGLGGQVWEIMNKNGPFDNDTARFIAACAVEALEYLHKNQIIYRDLKTDNMVIDDYGYVKLVDFGLAKQLGFTGRTWSFCGTPNNIAPEIILDVGHDRAVDYWTLGLLIYELLSGVTAFSDTDPMRAFEDILEGVEKIKFFGHIAGRPAEDIIKKLCTQNPSERLGYIKPDDIKEHRWFEGFEWKSLISRTMKPPKGMVPKMKNAIDTSCTDIMNWDLDTFVLEESSNWDHMFD